MFENQPTSEQRDVEKKKKERRRREKWDKLKEEVIVFGLPQKCPDFWDFFLV